MTKREFLDTVFALAPNEANAIMDAFDEYVESNVVPTGRSGKERRMSKYIIDTETWANLFEVQRVGVYGIGNDIVTDEKTVWSRMFSLDELEMLNSDYINEHFGELQDEAYRKGFEDGKKSASEPDRIEVGDEVNWDGDYFIVTKIFQPRNMKEQCDGIDDDGSVYHDILMEDLKKTGKHYDIQSILEAMRT